MLRPSSRTSGSGSGVERATLPGVRDGVPRLAEPAGLVVLERLADLGLGVHDERPGPRDRLADREAAEDDDVQPRGIPLLLGAAEESWMASPGPNTASWPGPTGVWSGPTKPSPLMT